MSKDFIAFDASDLQPPLSAAELSEWIDSVVGAGDASPPDSATPKIGELLEWASGKYGATVDEQSQWTLWPPALLADGRHCTFNLSVKADAMTFMMLMSDQCKRLGLIMIDPSGRNPFITTPGGAGILD
ncbi:hypothetical protein [Planctomycetes bacterium K23_9]|uniref:Uncharacterized protein n=1 Tax=Stieleria marina TaxID=1930275 RepID=A0A517NVU0_9BACT|nr:hypothetical protein K239x_32000 [Planctomycetes bacterium K23_9]